MSDLRLPSYPKVYNLGHYAIAGLFDAPVMAQEKVDGSQMSFAKLRGELVMRSKGAALYSNTADKLFKGAVQTACRLFEDLLPDHIYRGEVMSSEKHNTLKYGRVPAGNIILFDVQYPNESGHMTQGQLEAEAKRLGLEAVQQILPEGGQWSTGALEVALRAESALGGSLIEGVVFKDHSRFGKDGKFLAGKHVSEHFKETHKKAWKEGNPTRQDVVEKLKEELRTPARFNKGVQHLRERGELTGTPKDIGPLMKEVREDILAEEAGYIADTLLKHFVNDVLRGATAGLAEWYKDELAKAQFQEEYPPWSDDPADRAMRQAGMPMWRDAREAEM